MSKDIWHTQKETPEDDRLIVVENYSGFISVGSEFEYDLDRVRKWAYFDDLLALETENKDLSDKIGKLEIELEKTHKELEQSEICCTEWEKQALDYKAENIALSGDLERTRKALEVAIMGLKNCKTRDHIGAVCRIPEYVDKVLEQITALEQKDEQC